MDFKPLAFEDKATINHYLTQSDFQSCDYSFANLYIWADAYEERFCITHDMAVFRGFQPETKAVAYMFPAGNGDLKATVTEMLEDAHSLSSKLVIRGFTEKEANLLEEAFPGTFEISSPEEQWDYIYQVSDLRDLKGSHYHGKRNHISQFKRTYPDFSYEPITKENIHLCYDFAEEWNRYAYEVDNKDVAADEDIVKNALDNFFALDFRGGILFAERKPVAFTIGEPLNSDTFVVHVEKAFPFVKGAYPMINQQFVEHEMNKFSYINREEDDGLPGLRKAKQSYHPVKMVKKCVAVEK